MLRSSSQLDTLPMTDRGLDAVRDTLERMCAIVRKYRTDMNTINLASAILSNAGIRDSRKEGPRLIRSLQSWVRDKIIYMPDPDEVEMLQTPPRTVDRGMGDCDDKAILLATLLSTVGLKTRMLGVGFENTDGQYSHVMTSVKFGTGWMPLEVIVPGANPGWWPPGVVCLMARTV